MSVFRTVTSLFRFKLLRSVLLALFEGTPYLLCGLGDGTLLNYRIQEDHGLTEKKKLALGTKPISLRSFK